jgi:hypothetical protein
LNDLAARKADTGSEPVSRRRRNARRCQLVRAGGDEPYLLLPVRPDECQRTDQTLGLERFSRFVIDIQIQGSLLHDKLDHNLIVADTHRAAMLGFMIAMRASDPEPDEAKNRCEDH